MSKRKLLLVSAVIVAGYQLLPAGMWWEAAGQFGVSLFAAVTVLAAARRIEPGRRWPWVCFALGIASHGAGHVGFTHSILTSGTGGLDLWWLLFYPLAAAGTVGVIRQQRRRGGIAALIDSLMVATGMALFSWIAVIVPALQRESDDLAHAMVLLAYPAGDLVLITLLTHLLRRTTVNGPAGWLAAGLAFVQVCDLCWVAAGFAGMDLTVSVPVYRGVQQLFLVAYCCFAIAARQAAAAPHADAAPGRRTANPWHAMVLPTLAALVGPIILWFEAADGTVTDGRAIAVGCSVLFLLGGWRITVAMRMLARTNEQLREMARIDALTGLPNRRAWNDEFPRLLEHARRTGATVTVGVLDLDRFKAFNDTRGHQAGDDLLTAAAQAWRPRLRAGDLLARFGGEEFVVLLHDADGAEASQVLDRLQAATPQEQSFSGGVATWDGEETPHALLARADRALYRAKTAGRKRVTIAEPAALAVAGTPIVD